MSFGVLLIQSINKDLIATGGLFKWMMVLHVFSEGNSRRKERKDGLVLLHKIIVLMAIAIKHKLIY